jgi:hypothetical protein
LGYQPNWKFLLQKYSGTLGSQLRTLEAALSDLLKRASSISQNNPDRLLVERMIEDLQAEIAMRARGRFSSAA